MYDQTVTNPTVPNAADVLALIPHEHEIYTDTDVYAGGIVGGHIQGMAYYKNYQLMIEPIHPVTSILFIVPLSMYFLNVLPCF